MASCANSESRSGYGCTQPSRWRHFSDGGWLDFQSSKFNRITNALRQPGSSFKPFIYAAALDKGYTLATVINDAPVVIENPYDNSLWRPQNDTKKFYGPHTTAGSAHPFTQT